jgi:fumarate reductase subunit D
MKTGVMLYISYMKTFVPKLFTFLGIIAILVGALMKIQHKPYNNQVLILGIVFYVLAVVIGYLKKD